MRPFMETKIKQRIITLNSGKALLVLGAPKVGKTWIIQEALSSLGRPYLAIDLRTEREVRSQLASLNAPKDIVGYLSSISPVALPRGQSVIFFDHIQACPSLLCKIKRLVEDGSFSYVLSGGLDFAEPTLLDCWSYLMVYPLTFLEFAWAYGLSEAKISHLRDCFANRVPIDPAVHLEALSLFHYYLVCGGYPEAVACFIAYKNLNELNRAHKRIVAAYKTEFAQRGKGHERIASIYDNIPSQVNKPNRKFKFTLFDKEMKFERYQPSFAYLERIGAVYPCYLAKDAVSPIVSIKKNSFKLYLNDVGLLSSFLPRHEREAVCLGIDRAINKDGLYENFVASMLKSQSISPFYYKSKSIGEIDFLVDTSYGLTAIEVKSGVEYAKHKALDNLLSKYPSVVPIVLSEANLHSDESILYCPIYLAELIKNGW